MSQDSEGMPKEGETTAVDRLPLSFGTERIKYANGSWSLVANDISQLKDGVGERTLWAFARCFDAIDRLVSLTDLLPRNEKATARLVRNQWTAFILAAGLMHEVGMAIRDLAVKKRLSSEGQAAWKRLDAIVDRWTTGECKVARDNLAFHLDQKMRLFRPGLSELQRRRLPVVLVTGDKSTAIETTFTFGRDVLSLGLWPVLPGEETLSDEEVRIRRGHRLADFVQKLLKDQQTVRDDVQVMLFEVLKTDSTRRPPSGDPEPGAAAASSTPDGGNTTKADSSEESHLTPTDEQRIETAIGSDDGDFDRIFPDLKEQFIRDLVPAFPALATAVQSFGGKKSEEPSKPETLRNHMPAWHLLWDACNSLIAAFVLVRKGYQTEALAVTRLAIERLACAVVLFDNPAVADEFQKGMFDAGRAIAPAGRVISDVPKAWGVMSKFGSHVGKDNVGTSKMDNPESGGLQMAIGGHQQTADVDRKAVRRFVGDLCTLARCLALAPEKIFFSQNRIKATLDGKSSRSPRPKA